MSKALINEPLAGMELQGCVKHINQRKIDEFGAVSGGVGAIHLSPEFGKETPFKSTLVQGYLLLGYLTEMLKNNFGPRWITGGEMEVKLVGPAREGDTLVMGGRIAEVTAVENQPGKKLQCSEYADMDKVIDQIDESGKIKNCRCEIWIKNHKQELVAVGTALV